MEGRGAGDSASDNGCVDPAAKWRDPKVAARAILTGSMPLPAVSSAATRFDPAKPSGPANVTLESAASSAAAARSEGGRAGHPQWVGAVLGGLGDSKDRGWHNVTPGRGQNALECAAFVVTPEAEARWGDPKVAALKLLGLLPIGWTKPDQRELANPGRDSAADAIEGVGQSDVAAARWGDPQVVAEALLAPDNPWPGLFLTDPYKHVNDVFEWDENKHPRTGTPPNPGWFADVPKSLKMKDGKVHDNTWFGSKDPIGAISPDGKTVIPNTPGGANPGGPKRASIQDVGDQAASWLPYPGGWDEWFEAKDAARRSANHASIPPGGGGGNGAGNRTHNNKDAQPASPASQNHRPISKRVHEELENHPNLKGQYTPRDPRFTSRAMDDAAHKGYQDWHRKLDDEVAKWIQGNQKATPEGFERWLRWRYSQPDLKPRFPNGV